MPEYPTRVSQSGPCHFDQPPLPIPGNCSFIFPSLASVICIRLHIKTVGSRRFLKSFGEKSATHILSDDDDDDGLVNDGASSKINKQILSPKSKLQSPISSPLLLLLLLSPLTTP
ncbi:hypothetical protein G4B88_012521 [Cannabis sativa]|uniref:Uncharacterized protein n=1 Tax=Cannabis sativa TaxID=3483 RepID=A0A7J6I5Y2_CANSA|nr:hypothetical protein G4B88_012521 [Cannabis sativa]